jgi:5,5'-dehydrodivanillate O-demethylase
MLTKEKNERLTQVGPGTPGGELLRRYWYPVAASSQLPSHGTRPVKLLGESLVLYRDRSGVLGLIGDKCPHRSAGMIYGMPEADGIRCAYHGWKFDGTGRCLEQPFEQTVDPESTFKDRISITAYEVQEMGGMIFAYLGPSPAPLLPRWDLFTMDDSPREIAVAEVPCNWLQITENSLDPTHVEWLHMHFFNYVCEQLGTLDRQKSPMKHTEIGFKVFEHGIIKQRLHETATKEDECWTTGHPLVFPHILKSSNVAHPVFQIRVPVDDENTLYFWYTVYRSNPHGLPVTDPREIPIAVVPVPRQTGEPQWERLATNSGQDMAMWFTQGRITDRTAEHLGRSDAGIILFRKMLEEAIQQVERGEDPMNVIRNPADNVCLELQVEQETFGKSSYKPGAVRTGNVSQYSTLLPGQTR